MPISEAARLCPAGIFLPVRMYRYAELSREVMTVFSEFTPDVRPVSIDEAFLEMTGTRKLWGEPEAAARLLKKRVNERTGLTISVGVAGNPYVAKIASGLRKPDGLVLVKEGEEADFMASIPITKLWGAGEKTQARFRELGILSIAQLAAMGETALASLFGRGGGQFLWQASRGRDPGMMEGRSESRSMSSEVTFERDIADRGYLETVLLELAEGLSYRLWNEGLGSRCITLKLRLSDFSTCTRRRTREAPYRSAAEAWADGLSLLDAAWDGRSEIRLIGLGFAELENASKPIQGELFDEEGEKRRKAERAVYEIEKRGLGGLTKARILGNEVRGKREGNP
jgi:DNA polymerase-4